MAAAGHRSDDRSGIHDDRAARVSAAGRIPFHLRVDRARASAAAALRRHLAAPLALLGSGRPDGARRRLPAVLAAPRRAPVRSVVASALGASLRRADVLAQYRALPPAGEGAADDARQPAVPP